MANTRTLLALVAFVAMGFVANVEAAPVEGILPKEKASVLHLAKCTLTKRYVPSLLFLSPSLASPSFIVFLSLPSF